MDLVFIYYSRSTSISYLYIKMETATSVFLFTALHVTEGMLIIFLKIVYHFSCYDSFVGLTDEMKIKQQTSE